MSGPLARRAARLTANGARAGPLEPLVGRTWSGPGHNLADRAARPHQLSHSPLSSLPSPSRRQPWRLWMQTPAAIQAYLRAAARRNSLLSPNLILLLAAHSRGLIGPRRRDHHRRQEAELKVGGSFLVLLVAAGTA